MRFWQKFWPAAVLAISVTSYAGPSAQAPAGAPKDQPDQMERIKLPDYSAPALKGPNLQVYENNCLICHSARYVITQPDFSRSTWEKEVKKMVDAYGANISAADQLKIVDYLVAVRGAPKKK